MRRVLVALLLLGALGCDAGEPDERPTDDGTRAVDPAPTDAGGPTEYVEYGDSGAQPDLLPGGGAAPVTRFRLRVDADGCTVRRVGGRPPSGAGWQVTAGGRTVSDPDGDRLTLRPAVRGRARVVLVVVDTTAAGTAVQPISDAVRVRC